MASSTTNDVLPFGGAQTKTDGKSVFQNVREYLARRRRIAETAKELNNLTDRELNDIGISRYDIRHVAETSF